MSDAVSPVDLCNLALDRLGQDPIASILAPQTAREDICARWYDPTRKELLRDYIFNFSRKPSILTLAPNAPVDPNFANAFPLPVDLIRLLTIGDRILYGGNTPTLFFNISQGFIYTDSGVIASQGVQTPGLLIEYTFDATNVVQFDVSFKTVLWLQLARRMAYKFKPSSTLLKDLDVELEAARMKAAAVSGQEKPPRRVQRSRVRDVRRSGGIFRNNTII